jgi:hypothetical protein
MNRLGSKPVVSGNAMVSPVELRKIRDCLKDHSSFRQLPNGQDEWRQPLAAPNARRRSPQADARDYCRRTSISGRPALAMSG